MKRGTNEQVCHWWAQRLRAEQRGIGNTSSMANSSGSLYFAGDTIYSYGSYYPIARWVSYAIPIVFVNAAGSTPTTNRHKSIALRELPGRTEVYPVSDVYACSYRQHLNNFDKMCDEVKKVAVKWQSARGNKHIYAEAIDNSVAVANNYWKHFGGGDRAINIALVAAGARCIVTAVDRILFGTIQFQGVANETD